MNRLKKYVMPEFFSKEKYAIAGYVVAVMALVFCFVHFNVKPSAKPTVKPKQSMVEVDDDLFKKALIKDSCKMDNGLLTKGARLYSDYPHVISKIIQNVDTAGMNITATEIRLTIDDGYLQIPAQMLTNMVDNHYIKCVINK